jgi:hypothetical protein
MIERFVSFFSSLRLTIVCLALAFILVFIGTMAQVNLGLYEVQSRIFRSILVYWTPPGADWQLPVFPGGWLIGSVLLVNLLCAHIKRFGLQRRKVGLLLIHAGLILLLVGFFFTEVFQVESQMRVATGETKNYSEDSRRNELVVLDVTDPTHDNVVAIPLDVLAKGGEIHPSGLPLTLKVKRFLANSAPAGPMSAGEKIKADHGVGEHLLFTAAPNVGRLDDENKPAALIEVAAANQKIGDWTVSTWLTKRPWSTSLQAQFGALAGTAIDGPQQFTWAGRTYEIALRPVRYYNSYTLTLVEFKHDVYPGTDIPSNFSSRVHLKDPDRGEDRDVIIRMNSPLRYRGAAYYQASFEEGDTVSILQVVRNPAASTPYIACALIGLGLMVQFLMHLYGFARRKVNSAPAKQNSPTPARTTRPVLAIGRSKA